MRVSRFMAAHGASDYTILIIFSVVLGAVAGLAAVGFHETVALLSEIFSQDVSANGSRNAWLIILIPPLCMMLQWAMTTVAPREAK